VRHCEEASDVAICNDKVVALHYGTADYHCYRYRLLQFLPFIFFMGEKFRNERSALNAHLLVANKKAPQENLQRGLFID